MKSSLLLGVKRDIITPRLDANLFGYRLDVISDSVNDDLTATAFYFKQENKEALLVTLDLCIIANGFKDTLTSKIEERFGISKSCCIIHATHTHSGPTIGGMYGWGDPNVEYMEEILYPNVLSAIEGAISSARAVSMAIASGDSLIGINRREITPENEIKLGQNPWGPFNPKMTILSFKDESGEPVANLIHYGAHATAAGSSTEISRDWPGVMVDILEAETGAITAFINGPEGDVGPRLVNGKTTGARKISYAMRHGAVAGQDAVRVYKSMGVYHTPRLSVYTGEVNIPLDRRIPLDVATEAYEEFRGETVNHRGQMEHYYRTVIESYRNGYEEIDSIPFTQTIIRLGDVAIVSFPYELFSEIGLRIDRASEIPHVLSLSNANGGYGYFATESELCRGGYEIKMHTTRHIQPYVPDADWYLVTGTLENLKHT